MVRIQEHGQMPVILNTLFSYRTISDLGVDGYMIKSSELEPLKERSKSQPQGAALA
jgi:hypothetical protein